MTEWGSERDFKIYNISDNIRLSKKQCPSIYNLLLEAASILDINQLPELYIDSDYSINTYSFGIGNNIIVLCSGLIEVMSEDELLAVIGHELGHIKCNHMLYKTLAYFLSFGGELLSSIIPLGGKIVDIAIKSAIDEWLKMSTLTCDRAALLVTQNSEVVAKMLSKLAGFSATRILDEVNIDEVLLQAKEYEMCNKKMDKVLKYLQNRNRTHPLPIIRVKEIIEWSQSEDYRNIMEGNYLKNEDDKKLSTNVNKDTTVDMVHKTKDKLNTINEQAKQKAKESVEFVSEKKNIFMKSSKKLTQKLSEKIKF
jgi:Zn-dependent protease with chaperone function